MKKSLFIVICIIALFPLSVSFGSTGMKANTPGKMKMTPKKQIGEKAPYSVEGNTIHVHNKLCASSRSPISEKALGKFKSVVEYKGKNPKFKGKKFTFNQCCGGCVASFPKQWSANADEILKFHGIK